MWGYGYQTIKRISGESARAKSRAQPKHYCQYNTSRQTFSSPASAVGRDLCDRWSRILECFFNCLPGFKRRVGRSRGRRLKAVLCSGILHWCAAALVRSSVVKHFLSEDPTVTRSSRYYRLLPIGQKLYHIVIDFINEIIAWFKNILNSNILLDCICIHFPTAWYSCSTALKINYCDCKPATCQYMWGRWFRYVLSLATSHTFSIYTTG